MRLRLGDAGKTDPVPNPLLSGVNKNQAKFSFKTIGVQEIRAVLAKVKTAKNFRTDNISSSFLKLALLFIENFGLLFQHFH